MARLAFLLILAVLIVPASVTTGQEAVAIPADAPAEVREQMKKRAQEARARGGGPGAQPNQPPGKEPKKDGEKKGEDAKDKKEEDKPTVVTRPTEPKKAPDPKELEARPVDGKLRLQFQGHPWPAMIEWFSAATNRDVEWQELPNGFVNLRTQRPFTMAETGDLLNRLLLARGFTMLDDGEFLQIVKTEGLNPAFVPHVESRQLMTLQPHTFVRTSFQLHRFRADEIVKELEAMKSKHGTLSAMTSANRIVAMDTVRNLRDIYTAIDQEQSSGNHAPREFVIKYVRAEVVKQKLEEMLGVKKQQGPMTPQQMQQMQQMQRQRQQQQQKNGAPPQPAKKEEKISIVVNELRNSVIVKAPPHKMLDIDDAIRLLDVQPVRDSLDIQAYTMATRSPQELSDMLTQSGALSPNAIIRVDTSTKALLVSGTAFDHFRIEELIKSIDGAARRFESIRLRRYPALQVATTIEKMMGKPKEDDNNRRRRYYGYWWNNEEEENDQDQFRVAADVENNRLILKCNDTEYDMVISLLRQMGEVPTRPHSGSRYAATQVVIDDVDVDDQDELLRRVRQAFESIAPNRVVLPPEQEKEEETKDEGDDVENGADPAIEARNGDAVERGRTVSTMPYRTAFAQLQLDRKDEDRSGVEGNPALTTAAPPEPPPIVIERNARGQLILRSNDPAAIEAFEELMRQMAPQRQDWVYFKLKHVTAYWMKLQLEDFFEDEEENSNPFGFIFWGWDDEEEDDPPGLGDEQTMRFIDDGESTLVVRNASPKQLSTIKQLIDLYDVSEPPNEQTARFKKIIRIHHSKARVIETALKDAFRDLLSNNDKAFAQQNKNGGEREGGGRRSPFGFGQSTSTTGIEGTFKGKLSFGVDESTNSLIVTTTGEQLLKIVVDMVQELDRYAIRTDDTRVFSMPASLNSAAVRETLISMFGPESGPEKPEQEGQPEGEQPQEQGENGRRRPGGETRAVSRR